MKRKPCITLAIILSLALMIGGCAWFNSFLTNAVEKVCGFSVADSQEAQAAKRFISGAMPIVGIVFGATITSAQAEEIFDSVVNAAQTGGCVVLTELKAALDFFDKLAAQYQEGQPSLKGKILAKEFTPALTSLRAKVAGK